MPFISICILSYNRPDQLNDLLNSIDFFNDLEIIVSDDCSPRFHEIRSKVSQFKKHKVKLLKSEINQGYDKNLNKLVTNCSGEWIVFMGDDDTFIEGSLKKISEFLKKNNDLCYVLKSHYLLHEDGYKEPFKYFQKTSYFEPSEQTLVKLFRRSVYIAGFMIKRKLIIPFITSRFDGELNTGLNQIYYLSEVVLKYKSAYLDIPFTQQTKEKRHDVNEKMYDRNLKKFIKREPTIDISINFLKTFNKISSYLDNKHNINVSKQIQLDMSKYIYPSLSIHRDKGLFLFLKYVKEIRKINLDRSKFFYLYVLALTILNKNFCDKLILYIKKLYGYTPNL